jgi:hypothetical protein
VLVKLYEHEADVAEKKTKNVDSMPKQGFTVRLLVGFLNGPTVKSTQL